MPSSNPLISLGQLNRLKANVKWVSFPSLNVTPSFLHREGISLGLNGPITRFIPAYTGQVPSPEAYVPVTLRINLLKTQALSGQYKQQLELLSTIGDGVVRTDSTIHPPYPVVNCGIQEVNELRLNGEDAGWTVVIGGTYYVNSSLWQ